MKRRNAAEVYYSVQKAINSCINEVQLNNCEVLLEMVRFSGYAFIEDLCGMMLVKRCELIAEQYPVIE